MDFRTGSVRRIYFHYLAAAFGSSLISSIYGVVDMAMVGQYQGPDGTAAMAVVSPIWNIIYSLGLLTGIGGSVLFSTHVLEVAQKLCDRIAIIKGGRLVKMGTTASVVGDESLEQVFLELAQEGGAHA
mgnify:CR=1 FL=1